jgi:hypothetical protein
MALICVSTFKTTTYLVRATLAVTLVKIKATSTLLTPFVTTLVRQAPLNEVTSCALTIGYEVSIITH